MKLQFKHQKFQAEAADAVVSVFKGQPYATPLYKIDPGITAAGELFDFDGFRNQPLATGLQILENIQQIQRKQLLKHSENLEGRGINITVEMETGVGKTYTYIKTMYELNKHYGWSKFIIVVPSVAIREGVYKTFDVTQDHFLEQYGKKIRFFIYKSSQLTDIDRFASDSNINVMIINSQAFNATGKDARRISMPLDEFRSRRPIDILAKTNPVLVIDEPQSVEGEKTVQRLTEFNALFTLRYSATHKNLYNLVYRLDAMEAYNKKLVKKIGVKGISVTGTTATEGYVYLESIQLYNDKNPTAVIEFDIKTASGIKKVRRIVSEKFNLYENSGNLEEYKNGYAVARIDGRDNSVTLTNGQKLFAGGMLHKAGANIGTQLRRVQIRETIAAHLEKEAALFSKGIKVLSLFFIDEVAKYKVYDADENASGGEYARMFEEEYTRLVSEMQYQLGADKYREYLSRIGAQSTHAGYFSIDKNKKNGKIRFVDSKLSDKKQGVSDDTDAYDLIMKDKERLLDLNEPIRFIFSHSALREGWDNPNVFQICTLKKQSESDIRSRQEIGRGLRLCVNQYGMRMDAETIGEDVQQINKLTVVTDWEYEKFVKAYQSGLAEAVADRPVAVTAALFENRILEPAPGALDAQGIPLEKLVVDTQTANAIYFSLVQNRYVDKTGALTETWYEHRKNNAVQFADEVQGYELSVTNLLDSVYNPTMLLPTNEQDTNITLHVDEKKLNMKEFKELWKRINAKTAYTVRFDPEELKAKAIAALDLKLRVAPVMFKVQSGEMKTIKSKQSLEDGSSFIADSRSTYSAQITASDTVTYDLVGKLVEETDLTRVAVIEILRGIKPVIFEQFKNNPEEFILKAAQLINEEKATVIIEHITYNKLEAHYDTTLFTEPTLKGRLGTDAIAVQKHLYNYVLYDSVVEKTFASHIDTAKEVAVYVKLPGGFYIQTPVGKYSPDWAIAFTEGSVKQVFFVAETKGSMSTLQLKGIEDAKIHCAREHFKAISSGTVIYDVVSSYDELYKLIS